MISFLKDLFLPGDLSLSSELEPSEAAFITVAVGCLFMFSVPTLGAVYLLMAAGFLARGI